MTTPQGPPPPTWVRKRDGRLVPFEADRISRGLFAASEDLGQADPFLARELADVAVHFLAEEQEGTIPTTEQVHEVVLKVLRELKQHGLAAAFERHFRLKAGRKTAVPREANLAREVFHFSAADSPDEVRAACLGRYTLQAVYTRDLVAAHQDEVIRLAGLQHPDVLQSAIVGPLRRLEDLLPRLEEAAGLAGQTLALEGLEHVLAQELPAGSRKVSRQRLDQLARRGAELLTLGLRLAGRRAIVNLNGPPPPWADEAVGPLFASQPRHADAERLRLLADALAESLADQGERLRIDWHLNRDDLTAEAADRLGQLSRLALHGKSVGFVFDRPRQPIQLAEGIERGQAGVLLAVGLNLARLAKLVHEEIPDLGSEESGSSSKVRRAERFLNRLQSLARLSLSAASQKRDYLRLQARRRPELTSGFRLERARLLVVPLGLDEAVHWLLGQGLCAGEEPLELGRSILMRLRAVLQEEGRASTLEICLDAAEDWEAAGPTCWTGEALMKRQLSAVGAMHEAAGGGSGVVFLPADPPPTPAEVANWLRWAWEHTAIVRLRLARVRPPLKQMTFSEV